MQDSVATNQKTFFHIFLFCLAMRQLLKSKNNEKQKKQFKTVPVIDGKGMGFILICSYPSLMWGGFV